MQEQKQDVCDNWLQEPGNYLKMLLRGPIKHPPVPLEKFTWNSVKAELELRDLFTLKVKTT